MGAKNNRGAKKMRLLFGSRFFSCYLSCFIVLASCFILPKTSSAQSSGSPIQVSPDTVDFGRVRIGEQRDSSFAIVNVGSVPIQLTSLDFLTSLQGTEFTADSIHGKSSILDHGPTPPDTVHFIVTQLGSDTGRIPIYWVGDSGYYIAVVLLGTGVAPNVISSNYNFQDERVDSGSQPVTISIANIGSDTTAIDSVTIVDSSEIADSDFIVTLDSLPPSGTKTTPLRIGYKEGDSVLSFTVQFQPRSLGMKTLIIRIHTIDGDSIFDTITGRGVEPLVLLSPQIIDFGTIEVQPNGTPDSTVDTFLVVSNAAGTYPAILDTLTHDTSGNFSVSFHQPMMSHDTLAAGSVLTDSVRFNITEEGDFADTVYIPNDTRYNLYSSDGIYKSDSNYRPMIILKAKVRTGSIGAFSVSFDTITTCDTVSDSVAIVNPYPVEVYIDSILLVSDTAGFSYRQNSFLRISIPPHGTYPLFLDYSFPPDSLNGPQALKIALFQRSLDSETPVVDTVTASLVRKQQVMTLAAHLPPAGSVGTSAADVSELRLPITLEGPRSGVTELNSWTLSLQFSNDLFAPTGVDVTNSLSVAGDASYSLTPYWDQSTRTYTIVATGTAVSDPAKIANNLLLTILLQAYVTTDTVVTVTPTFTWTTRPCAYNLQSFLLSISYADDCGDETIREFMEGGTPSFILTGAWPNPVTAADGVSIGYRAAEASEVTTTVFSAAGEALGHIVSEVGTGAGTIALPEGLIPSSGPAFVCVEAVSMTGGTTTVQTCKIAVMK
jgi:hypothetical protein